MRGTAVASLPLRVVEILFRMGNTPDPLPSFDQRERGTVILKIGSVLEGLNQITITFVNY